MNQFDVEQSDWALFRDAIRNDKRDEVQRLIDAGCDVNADPGDHAYVLPMGAHVEGDTIHPLDYAIVWQRPEIAAMLAAAGAKVSWNHKADVEFRVRFSQAVDAAKQSTG